MGVCPCCEEVTYFLGQRISLERIISMDDLDTPKITWLRLRFFALFAADLCPADNERAHRDTQKQRIAQRPAPRHAEKVVRCLPNAHHRSLDSETLWPKALYMVWRAPGSFQEASGRIVATYLSQWPCRLIVKCKRVGQEAKRWG